MTPSTPQNNSVSPRPFTIPKWILIVLVTVAIIGFADSVYLTIEHFQNRIPPCTIGGCETVLTSKYAEFFGIPVSLLGSIYYFLLALFSLLFIDFKKEILLKIPFVFLFFGVLASIWFSYLQIFVIKAFCPYCAVSAIISLTVFLMTFFLLREIKIDGKKVK